MCEWQPIETAPYEVKQKVLVLDNEGNVRMARWYSTEYLPHKPRRFVSDFDFGDFSSTCYWPDFLYVTHWMPLPEPPKGTNK